MADVVTVWNPFIITNLGLNLRQETMIRPRDIAFSAKIGQGVPVNPANIPLMTEIVQPAHEVPVVRSEQSGATHFVGVRIDNQEFPEPVLMREIGLFASVDGGEPFLYGYTYATQGYDSIPAGSVSHYIWTVGIDTVLSRAQNISFTYNGSAVYASYEDIDQLIQSFADFKAVISAMHGGVVFSEERPEENYPLWLQDLVDSGKVRLVARRADGTEAVVYPETISEQVKCFVTYSSEYVGEDGEPITVEIGLDELLRRYANEINVNAQTLTEHTGELRLLARPRYAVCDTPGNVVAKTVDLEPFLLEVGEKLTINFVNENTALTATLNVASSGAKPLLYKDQPIPAGFLSGIQSVCYDGANWNIVGDLDMIAEHSNDPEAHPDIRAANAEQAGRIQRLEDMVLNDITGNQYAVTFGDMSGLVVTGVWNTALQRVEF